MGNAFIVKKMGNAFIVKKRKKKKERAKIHQMNAVGFQTCNLGYLWKT